MLCDGTGFYAFIDLPPGTYTLTANQQGYPEILRNGIQVLTGSMTVEDVAFGAVTTPPVISGVQVTGLTHDAATINWTTDVPGTSRVNYGTTPAYGTLTPLNATETVAHSVPLTGLTLSITYYFEVTSSNGFGSNSSGGHTFMTPAFSGEIVIDNLDPGWANTSPSGGWTSGSIASVPKIGTDYLYATGVASTAEGDATRKCTWTAQVPAAGRYSVSAFYQIGANRTTAAPYKVTYPGGELITLQNQYSTTPNLGDWFPLAADIVLGAGATCAVQLSNNTGDTALVSADAAKIVYIGAINPVGPDFDGDGDVDADDFGHYQACATGPNVAQDDPGCADCDLDNDGDVDMTDFGVFQRCISGANLPPDPGCAGQP
jgi:hypothetical protein